MAYTVKRLVRGVWLTGLVGVTVVSATLAAASETPGTRIEHRPVESVSAGERIGISAKVSDPSGVELVRAYFRAQDASDFSFVGMELMRRGSFEGTLPAPANGTDWIDYLLLAKNGANQVVKSQTFRMRVEPSVETPSYETPIRVHTELEQAPRTVGGFRDNIVIDVVESGARYGVVAGLTNVSSAGGAGAGGSASFGGTVAASRPLGMGAVAVGGLALLGLAAAGGGGGGGNPQPTPAGCGSADGTGTVDPPDQGLCSQGDPSAVQESESAFFWQCLGSGTAEPVPCSAPREYQVAVSAGASCDGSGIAFNPTSVTVGFEEEAVFSYSIGPERTVDSAIPTCPQAGVLVDNGQIRVNPIRSACGVEVLCSDASPPVPSPLDGQCGSANLSETSAEPTSGLCNLGSASQVNAEADRFTWTCSGTNGGLSASCEATRQYAVDVVNLCTLVSVTPPSQNVEYNGTATVNLQQIQPGLLDPQVVHQQCTGSTASSGPGQISVSPIITSCTLGFSCPAVTGQCGPANGTVTGSAPTTGLCSVGDPSSVDFKGAPDFQYEWECVGRNQGATVSCSAPQGEGFP